jgi:hypothetical protein
MRGPWRSFWETPRGEEEAGDPAPGIIATLQAGYERLNERPYLIAVPLALDLALWLGPRIIAPDLFNWLARWPEQSASGAQLAETLHQRGQSAEMMTGVAQTWNWYGVSTLVGKMGRDHFPLLFHRPAVEIAPWYIAIAVFCALLVVGLWLKALFITPIGQLVRQEPFALGWNLRASLVGAKRLLLLFLAVAGMLLLALVPVALIAATFVLAGINAFGLILLAAVVPLAWALFYGAYAMDAIFLEQVGPMRAAYLSYRVVRRNVWPTMGFVTLTFLISRGVPLALTRVVQHPVGMLLAIIAHAYVAAGLAAGSLLFYRERRARVRDVRPEHEHACMVEVPASGQQVSEG